MLVSMAILPDESYRVGTPILDQRGSDTGVTINAQTAALLVDTAADAIVGHADSFPTMLDEMPAAIYVTDQDGTITYFNPACVDLAGRTPEVGVDKWCVTWKLLTTQGEHLPHDECPMAVAIREKKPVREHEAVARRPDGTTVHFVPFPTPLFDREGNFVGAVNLLLDVTDQRTPEYLGAQADRCRRLASAMLDPKIAESLQLMAVEYDEQSLKSARLRLTLN